MAEPNMPPRAPDVSALLAQRLDSFFRQYRELAGRGAFPARLGRFLAAAHPMLARQGPVPARGREPDPARLAAFFGDLSPALARARAAGVGVNPWAAAGLRRDEVRNAGVLASLWNPQFAGPSAIAFLDRFLQMTQGEGQPLPTSAQLAAGYVIRTEHCPAGARTERVDITIEGADFLLLVEVKIGAGESGPDQFDRYARTAREWGVLRGIEAPALILLAPRPIASFSGHFGTWRQVAQAARADLPRHSADYSFNDMLRAAFAAHVEHF